MSKEVKKMNIFENILINLIFIIFPLILWLLYQTYSKTLNIEKSKIFLDCALFSSIYLIIKFGIYPIKTMPILLFNIYTLYNIYSFIQRLRH